MASYPQSPRHSRHPSSIDFSNSYNSTNSSPKQERRQSRSSLQDAPATPLLRHQNSGLDIGIFSSGAGLGAGGNGLGNLADELADAFSDDGEDYEDGYYDPTGEVAPDTSADVDERGAPGAAGTRDSGVEVESPAGQSRRVKSMSLSLPSPTGRRGKAGSEYDGSEYGSESDLDSPGMPPGLVAKIAAVESLARRGTESNGSAADGAFKRVTEGLRDLSSQAGVEGGATR